MGADLRLPSINAQTDRGQLEQMRSYLYQLVQQLNYLLSAAGTGAGNAGEPNENTIKSIVLNSTEILNTFYSMTKQRLDDVYVSLAEFGVWIRLGVPGNDPGGNPVYGVEIGRKTEQGFEKYARFTKSGVSFYPAGAEEPGGIAGTMLIDENGFHGSQANTAVDSDILAFALSCRNGFTPFETDTGASNLPESEGYDQTVGYVHRRSEDWIKIRLTNNETGAEAVNLYHNNTWSGWKFITPQ